MNNAGILDIGCGTDPHGTVNVDLFEGKCYDDVIKTMPKGNIKNPVMASAEYLPFRGNIFRMAVSFAVLEHVNSPVAMIKEMVRVSRRLLIGTPNAYHSDRVIHGAIRGCYYPYFGHIYTWGLPEIENLMHHCGLRNVKVSYYIPNPIGHKGEKRGRLGLLSVVLKKIVDRISPPMLRGKNLLVEGTCGGY